MKLTIPALNELMQKLEAQPNLTSTTPGPKCPECGLPYIVSYGRRSKAWIVLHPGVGTLCVNRAQLYKAETQAEALALAERIARGEA